MKLASAIIVVLLQSWKLVYANKYLICGFFCVLYLTSAVERVTLSESLMGRIKDSFLLPPAMKNLLILGTFFCGI